MPQTETIAVSIIGGGRVGGTMGCIFKQGGASIRLVTSRSSERAAEVTKTIGEGTPCEFDVGKGVSTNLAKLLSEDLSRAIDDLLVITVRDDAIEEVSTALASAYPRGAPKYVIHCSGGTDLEALNPFAKSGSICGVLHPCYPVMQVLEQCPRSVPLVFSFSGSDELADIVKPFIDGWGAGFIRLGDVKRKLYHAANVLSTGHVVALLSRAHTLLVSSGVSDGDALAIVRSLVGGAIDNLNNTESNSAQEVFERIATGPFVRGDERLISEQRRAIKDLAPELEELFVALGEITRSNIR